MNLLQKAKSNSFFSNSVFIFLIRFFPTLANVMVLIYYSHYLDTDTYGTYQNFWIQLNILCPLACLGIHAFIVTYSPAYIVELVRSLRPIQYLTYALWVLLLCSVFAFLQYKPLHTLFIIPFSFLMVFATTIILEAALIVFRSFKGVVFINFLFSSAFFIIHWYALKHTFSLEVLFACLFIISSLRLLAYIFMLIPKIVRQQDKREIKDALSPEKARSLWLHLGLFDILQMSFNWVDKFVISLFLSAGLSAIYYNGSINIPFLPMLLGVAGSAALIELSVTDKENEKQHSIFLMLQSARVLASIIFPVFLFLLFYRYQFITVVFSEKYIPAVPIFLVSIMVLPLKAYNFITVLQNQHKGSIISIGAVVDILLACALMYPLYLWLGLPGVALSFVISSYLQAAFYLYYSGKALSVNMFSLLPVANWSIKLIVFAIILIAIHYVTNLYFSNLIALILGGVATTAIVLISLLTEVKNSKRSDVNLQKAV